MQKRTYYIPTIEITDIKGLNPLAFGDVSGKAHMPAIHREKAF